MALCFNCESRIGRNFLESSRSCLCRQRVLVRQREETLKSGQVDLPASKNTFKLGQTFRKFLLLVGTRWDAVQALVQGKKNVCDLLRISVTMSFINRACFVSRLCNINGDVSFALLACNLIPAVRIFRLYPAGVVEKLKASIEVVSLKLFFKTNVFVTSGY